MVRSLQHTVDGAFGARGAVFGRNGAPMTAFLGDVEIVALLPEARLASLRGAAGATHAVRVVTSPSELDAVLELQRSAVVVIAPEHGESLVAVLTRHPTASVVSYALLTRSGMRAQALLGRRGYGRVVIAGFDDDVEIIRDVIADAVCEARSGAVV